MLTQLLLACVLSGLAPSQDCLTVNDSLKRSFNELGPVSVDVDGDGKNDTITPKIYAARPDRRHRRGGWANAKEIHWIAFDLKSSKGRVQRSFFSFAYGTNEADYWIYALVPCDVNRDGRTDLVFYTGDDMSDDTVVLMNRGGVFRVHSRKHTNDDGLTAVQQ